MLPYKRKIQTNLFILFLSILLVKTYFVRLELFNDYDILKLLFFETGFIAIFLCIIELFFKKARIFLYHGFDLIYSAFLLAVLLYNKQFGRILNYHSLKNIAQLPAVKDSIMVLLKPSYLLLFCDLLILPLIFLILRAKISLGGGRKLHKRVVVLVIAFAVITPSAGYVIQSTDLNGKSIDIASQIGLANYQVFEAWSTYIKNRDDNFDSSAEEINELKGIVDLKNPVYFGQTAGKNIILVQVEALQNFVLGLKIDGCEVTPNLNRLINESLYFPNFYSQIAQGNTSDAEFITSTSLYPVEDGVISSDFTDRVFPSFPRMLKDIGYDCLTFHPNVITFWNRDKLYPALGFDKAYDLSFFGFEDVIGMGSSDEVLYSKTEKVLYDTWKAGKKFYASIVTLSNHHPFVLPPEKQILKLTDNLNNTFVGNYLQSVCYTDYALGKFLELLQKDGILDDTLIVIYGDHYGLPCSTLEQKDRDLIESVLNRHYRVVDSFNVPLIIRLPGGRDGKVIRTAGGQVDIMPTIANLAGVSMDNSIYFGRDILNNTDNTVGIRYYMPSGSFINSEVISARGGTVTDLSTGKKSDKNYSWQQNRIIQLENLSDMYIRSLPLRK